jgi:hypothetical protein
MLPDEVREAVEWLEQVGSDPYSLRSGHIIAAKLGPLRAHLLAREAEVEGMRTLLDLLRTGRDGQRYACIQSRSGSMVSVEDYLAHLSENSHDA